MLKCAAKLAHKTPTRGKISLTKLRNQVEIWNECQSSVGKIRSDDLSTSGVNKFCALSGWGAWDRASFGMISNPVHSPSLDLVCHEACIAFRLRLDSRLPYRARLIDRLAPRTRSNVKCSSFSSSQRLFGLDSPFNLQPPHPVYVFEPVGSPIYSFAIRSLARWIRENTGGPALKTPPLITAYLARTYQEPSPIPLQQLSNQSSRDSN